LSVEKTSKPFNPAGVEGQRSVTKKDYRKLEAAVLALPGEFKRSLFRRLRQEIPIHRLEAEWNTTAEDILEAIARGSDLTHRGIRGMLAEASFKHHVLEKLTTWKDVTPTGDFAFDYLVEDSLGRVRIQVKNQRTQKGEPLVRKKRYNNVPVFIVET
jgi:hypothetical protein